MYFLLTLKSENKKVELGSAWKQGGLGRWWKEGHPNNIYTCE
jgi:hypothetical protein